jgi:hypothetical protein
LPNVFQTHLQERPALFEPKACDFTRTTVATYCSFRFRRLQGPTKGKRPSVFENYCEYGMSPKNIPKTMQVPTREDVEGMRFTASCLQESLRKYSIVPLIVREANRDTELLGHSIPRGTKCALMVSCTHAQWDSPREYRPDRFMPGGEFEQFPEDIRRCDPVTFRATVRVVQLDHFDFSRVVVVLALEARLCQSTRGSVATSAQLLGSCAFVPLSRIWEDQVRAQ